MRACILRLTFVVSLAWYNLEGKKFMVEFEVGRIALSGFQMLCAFPCLNFPYCLKDRLTQTQRQTTNVMGPLKLKMYVFLVVSLARVLLNKKCFFCNRFDTRFSHRRLGPNNQITKRELSLLFCMCFPKEKQKSQQVT